MTVDWDAADPRVAPRTTAAISYVLRGPRERLARPPPRRRAAAPGRSYAHLGPRRSGVRQPGRRAGRRSRSRCPGVGDFRVPALVVERPGRLDRARPAVRRATGSSPASRPCRRPPVDLRRGGRRGRHARDRPRRRADRPAGHRCVRRCSRAAPVVARSLRLGNGGTAPLVVAVRDERRRSTCRTPTGTWSSSPGPGPGSGTSYERPLVPGRQSVGSLRGGSGTEHNPFLALRRATTTEDAGEACGLQPRLLGQLPRRGRGRRRSGPRGCGSASTRRPSPGASSRARRSRTPEAVHRLVRRGPRRRVRGLPRPVPRAAGARPVARPAAPDRCSTTGRATYFDFDHERLVAIAAQAKDLGVELFVLDDGWFGARDDDNSSLGDWIVDRRKLPAASRRWPRDVHALGLDFGIWIEPEMVNADSDLFRAHPEWAIGVPGRRADREPPAARARLRAARGRRPPRRRHRRSSRARRSTT